MTPTQLLDEVKDNFDKGQRRRHLPGLLIAFIRTLRELNAIGGKFKSLEEFYENHPLQTKGSGGASRNAWAVLRDAKRPTGKNSTLSIRGHYDDILAWFYEQRRFDYPSSAPHATQSWVDYEHWLEALLQLDDAALQQLEEDTKAFVLEKLPEQTIDRTLVQREPPRFYLFLRDFDLTKKKGELTGAAYQGTVFGYLRADASHLQVDVAKVRTGSKRVGRIGDIDARDGELLALSAEVKQYVIPLVDVPGFSQFADQVAEHGALGMVVALDFEEGAREALKELGLEAVSKEDLMDRVALWDALKQNIATQALLYYVYYVEKNSALYKRLREFLAGITSAPAVAVPDADDPAA